MRLVPNRVIRAHDVRQWLRTAARGFHIINSPKLKKKTKTLGCLHLTFSKLFLSLTRAQFIFSSLLLLELWNYGPPHDLLSTSLAKRRKSLFLKLKNNGLLMSR